MDTLCGCGVVRVPLLAGLSQLWFTSAVRGRCGRGERS